MAAQSSRSTPRSSLLSSSRNSTHVGNDLVRDLFFAMPGYWLKARPLKSQDVQGESEQSEFKEVPAYSQFELNAFGCKHNHEAHQHPRNSPVFSLPFSFTELNLADNSISEYGMHAVKNLIAGTHIEHLNLASNMISEVGLSLILEELIKNTHLRSLSLGIEEGSIRKNSFGIDGARCLAAILLQNKTL